MNGSVCPINPNLKGAFIGLTWRHKKQNLYRALLESIAYEYAIYLNIERSLVPKMEMSEARVIGGGSKSKLWNQIKADVLGIPYLKLKREEFGTLGSAIIAGFATGVIKDMKEAADNFNEIYYKLEPDKEKQKIYNKYSCIYLQLLSKTERLFNELEHSFVYFS
jgi:xylulokinase